MASASEKGARDPAPGIGLSARLLLLTIFFVLLAEFLIYAPSIGRYRKVYLEEQVSDARLATLALDATPDEMMSRNLESRLLFFAAAHGIVLRYSDRRMMVLSGNMPGRVDATYDLRKKQSFIGWISEAFAVLARDKNRILRVIGPAPREPDVVVEVIIDEAPMRDKMLGYSTRILQLSLVISFITAGLVYISLQWLMVGPMRRITAAMTAFRENPEDCAHTIRPSRRGDEIGFAQRELAEMQKELRAALGQKTRLATLGAAVAKVNHDLRNSLATAVLASDKLANIDDPEVRKVAPRLFKAVNRAVALCSQTLNYAGGGLERLDISLFHLHELVAEVAAALRAPGGMAGIGGMEENTANNAETGAGNSITILNDVDFAIDVAADRVQLFRVFYNLCINAGQAAAKTVSVSAKLQDKTLIIEVADDGEGFSGKAREKLFQPFAGSAREGGTGLGLVIAHDIMRAHGGNIELIGTGPAGARFRLTLPITDALGA
ncbi:MAG TPA: HAMP domain-containing histidine kinase [Alphaproteobacteria bacterium]|nr:HAMP domain-containing histidine kinase [Alphaproteobacteria bacterium]